MNMMDFSLITDKALDYCVYMHKNKINGKVYVGISRNIKNRWCANGRKYKRSPDFYKAIQEFGWDNFEHIIIEENLPKSIALIMECELIKKYNLTEVGYNKSQGSWDSVKPVIPRPVYQYELDGTFVKKWDSISQAVNIYGDGVYKNVNGKSNKAGGFQWTENYVEKMPPYGTDKRRSYLPIFEYSVDGDFIKEWHTMKEAIEQFSNQIMICAQGKTKTSHNRRWSFEKVDKLPPLPQVIRDYTPRSYKETPKVFTYNLYGELIKIYDNIAAIDDPNIDLKYIHRHCKQNNYLFHNNILWVYENYTTEDSIQNIINEYREIHYKIIQYDMDGNYLKTFLNYDEVRKQGYNSRTVANAVKHRTKTAYGYQWGSEFDIPPGKVEYKQKSYKNVPIIQKTMDDEIIKIFKNPQEAVLEMNIKRIDYLLYACKGNKESAYGYKWQFATREEYENYIATKNNYENQEVM